MKAHVLSLILGVLVAATSSAAPTLGEQGSSVSDRALVSQAPQRKPLLAACMSALKKDGNWYYTTFRSGARYGYTVDENGLPISFTYTSPDGVAISEDVVTHSETGNTTDLPPEVQKDESYKKIRARLSTALLGAINANCKRSSGAGVTNAGATPQGGSNAALIGGGTTNPSPMDVNDPFMDQYGNWTAMDFFGEADWLVQDHFYNSMWDWEISWQQNVPQCVEVIRDCKLTCDRVGAYGGGVLCAGLGATAGSILTPPIGISVGAYCAGKVFQAVEECRGGCSMPVVICSK